MKTMRGFADRMLERLVPQETAGACYWYPVCIRNQPCANFSQYTQRRNSCTGERQYLFCGCS
ncbi:hypothetical protein ACFWAT_03525 [Streptomyces syringium]|uniref:hypothetical protein n=1 Tax=Streptomyces TaxID=1883 RepID=UPI0035173AC7